MKPPTGPWPALTCCGQDRRIHFDDQATGFGHRYAIGAGGKLLRHGGLQYRHADKTRTAAMGSARRSVAEHGADHGQEGVGRVANGEDPQAHKADRRGKDKNYDQRHTSRISPPSNRN